MALMAAHIEKPLDLNDLVNLTFYTIRVKKIVAKTTKYPSYINNLKKSLQSPNSFAIIGTKKVAHMRSKHTRNSMFLLH